MFFVCENGIIDKEKKTEVGREFANVEEHIGKLL